MGGKKGAFKKAKAAKKVILSKAAKKGKLVVKKSSAVTRAERAARRKIKLQVADETAVNAAQSEMAVSEIEQAPVLNHRVKQTSSGTASEQQSIKSEQGTEEQKVPRTSLKRAAKETVFARVTSPDSENGDSEDRELKKRRNMVPRGFREERCMTCRECESCNTCETCGGVGSILFVKDEIETRERVLDNVSRIRGRIRRGYRRRVQRPALFISDNQPIEWPGPYEPPTEFLPFPSNTYCHVNDNVHGHLYLYDPIKYVIDTSEFQRLRRLKQTGMVYLVYPNSEHTRFAHSLGVYCLALDFVRTLAQNQPELEITSRDILCVALAGLCHDLGHGPYSHTFERIVRAKGFDFRHEHQSTRIFRRIMKIPRVRYALAPYLNLNEDIDFVCEMIDPPKQFVVDGKWMLKGRQIDKSYLYGIVSNVHDSFDVDKYDYLMRDAKGSAPVSLNPISVTRIRDGMRVGMDTALGFQRLIYSDKVKSDLLAVSTTRFKLHETHYQHHTVCAAEYMVGKAFEVADTIFQFRVDDFHCYTLTTAYQNLDAFLQLDDYIYSVIPFLHATHYFIDEACDIFHQLESRNIPPLVAETDVIGDITVEEFEDYLVEKMEIAGISDEEIDEDFFVLVKDIHCGMGRNTHPLSKVLLYNHRSDPKPKTGAPAEKSWLDVRTGSTGLRTFMVFTDYEATDTVKSTLYNAVVEFAKEHRTSSPIKRTPTKTSPIVSPGTSSARPTTRSMAVRRLAADEPGPSYAS